MSKTIKFEIVTPERVVLKDEVAQITVPTQSGEITILPNHIPLVGVLTPGVIETVDAQQEREVMAVSGGFVQVMKDKIVILADTAERASELDEARLAEARQRAEDMKKELRQSDRESFTRINARIAVQMARGKAIGRWKRLKNIK